MKKQGNINHSKMCDSKAYTRQEFVNLFWENPNLKIY